MVNYINSGKKSLGIGGLLNKVLRVAVNIIILLIILEAFLQINGFIYQRTKCKIKNPEVLKENSLRIMFIGDSWTAGADAPQGLGYVPLTLQKLNRYPFSYKILGYNFAYGSTNSSQAIHQFLDNYPKIKPHLLIVLTGANDGWNTQDIITANNRIRNYLLSNKKNPENVTFNEHFFNSFIKLKTVKLYNLVSYALFYKSKEIKIPLPDNEYAAGYHKIFTDTRDREKAREYLINNYKSGITNYNDLYKLMLHSFSGNIDKVLEYLREKNILKLRLIKDSINIKQNERYLNKYPQILEQNLRNLKSFCDQEGIIMVLANYPHLALIHLNKILDEMANKFNIVYVDNFNYFKEKISLEEWNKISTLSHVNYKGHEYIADNLTALLSDIVMYYRNK